MSPSRIASGVVLAASVILLAAGDASAQRRGGSPSRSPYAAPEHRLEIVPYGGYRWTVSIDNVTVGARTGKLDFKSTGFYGLALDINVPAPDTQIRLAYDRQDTQIEFTPRSGLKESQDASVEYLQIGALKGLRQDNILPFGVFTLGATRYASEGDDEWKFSVVLGLGAKIYLSDRIGLMVQGRMPYTFLASGIGVGIGTGGVGAGITGWGFAQFDIGGGITILL